MKYLSDTALWIYIVLLLIGGLIGFWKAKSRISLVISVVFAALLALTTMPELFQASLATNLANGILVLLLVVFAIRLAKTKRMIPAGMMLFATIAVLILRNLPA